MPKPPKEGDGYRRTGRIFAFRLTDDERAVLELKEKQSRHLREGDPGGRRTQSLGAYVVWAALQWQSPQLELIPEAPGPVRRRRPAARKKSAKRGKVRPKPKPKPKKKGGRHG